MEEVRLICTLLSEINHLLFTLHRVFTAYSCHLCKPINATQLVASLVQAGTVDPSVDPGWAMTRKRHFWVGVRV